MSFQFSKSLKKRRDAEELIISSFENISHGQLELQLPSKESLFFKGKLEGPSAKMIIHDALAFEMIIERTDIGLGEAYMQGLWESDDVSNVIEFAVINKEALRSGLIGIWHKVLIYKIKHFFNFNSKSGSRKNIQAHYDLGNEFYKLWLDKSMTYSSAFWGGHQELSLNEAQLNKYEQLLSVLKAKKGSHILEIGCGWGGFLEYAGSRGHRVTGITISKEQFDYALKRIEQAGLSKNVEILFVDYRDVVGTYDHVVSIEMIEAVGQSYWPLYFKKIKEVVKPGGSVAIQGITIHDEVFESYKKGTDFIQQYIFPGGMLPCENEIKKNVELINSSQLNFTRFGQDYARTLKIWAENFFLQKDNIESLGYSLEFQRMWIFYLKYCEGAFRAGQINVVLLSYTL